VEYAGKYEVDYSDPSESELANYFAQMAGTASATTISNARSAIGQTLELIRGKDALGPLTNRVISGARKQKPPQPRYESIWSFDTLFEHVKGWGDTAKLNFAQLTDKLIILLTFEFFARPSDLAKIVFSSIKDYTTYFTLQLVGPKEQKGTAHSSPIMIKGVPLDSLLCPVVCLRQYIDQSKSKRSNMTPNRLMLAQRKSVSDAKETYYDALGSQRISNRMKSVLQDAGVDIEKWTGGSGRAAAASTAKDQGVSLEEILKKGRWTRESTFRRFYDKEINNQLQTSNLKSSEDPTEGELVISSKSIEVESEFTEGGASEDEDWPPTHPTQGEGVLGQIAEEN